MPEEASAQSTPDPPEFSHEAISIESSEIEPNLFRVDFTVAAEQVRTFIEKLRKVKKDIHPQEVSTLLITVCLDEALLRLDRKKFFDARIAEDGDRPVLHPDKPFKGSFITDGFAKPEWPDFSLLTFSPGDTEVTDALVERELLDQRLDAGIRSPLEGPLAAFDEVELDAKLRPRGRTDILLEMPDMVSRAPEQGQPMNLGRILVDGGDALIGHQAGDTITFASTLPENLGEAGLRGRDVDVELTLKTTRRIAPATDEDVATRFGSPSVDVLRMQIRFALESRLQEQSRADSSRQLMPQLHQLIPISIPQSIIDELISKQLSTVADKARKEGIDEDGIKSRLDTSRERITNSASRIATRRVMVSQLGDHLGIRVTEEDILEEIRSEADRDGRRPEELRKELVDSGRIGNIGDRCQELKILDHLTKLATII
ncbi:MAG: hypothetical protein GY895_03205 [Phycisphaera sp.]|nr:hypothetical protein [Phycisphaera sp.]